MRIMVAYDSGQAGFDVSKVHGRRAAIAGMALASLVAASLTACGSGAQGPHQPAPAQVGVVVVQPTDAPLEKDLVGRLSAYRSADIRARVAGVLLKRDYVEGSEVKKGQLLFQIDPTPLKAALDNAKAQLAQAQATYTNARVNAQRARQLAPKGYISKTALDDALANERTTKAAVQAAQANVETTRINLGYARVTSPIAGRAGEQQVTEGALVGQNGATLLTTVEQTNPLYVNFTISISELNELRQSQRSGDIALSQPDHASVKVSLPDGTPYPRRGTVDFSSPKVNPATGAVNLRAVLPNPGFTLLPGSYVELQVTLGERHHVFLVPQAAVQRDVTGAYVLTVDQDGKVARNDVKTGGMHGVDWIILSGLASGDKVIVSGIQTALVGTSAKATPWQPPVAGASAGNGPGSAMAAHGR